MSINFFYEWIESYIANPKMRGRCGHPPFSFFSLSEKGDTKLLYVRAHTHYAFASICCPASLYGAGLVRRGEMDWKGRFELNREWPFVGHSKGGRKKPHRAHKHLARRLFLRGKGKYHVDIVGKKQQEYMRVASKQIAFTVEIFYHFSSAIDFFFSNEIDFSSCERERVWFEWKEGFVP